MNTFTFVTNQAQSQPHFSTDCNKENKRLIFKEANFFKQFNTTVQDTIASNLGEYSLIIQIYAYKHHHTQRSKLCRSMAEAFQNINAAMHYPKVCGVDLFLCIHDICRQVSREQKMCGCAIGLTKHVR